VQEGYDERDEGGGEEDPKQRVRLEILAGGCSCK
jgi:hypothetical protein